MMENIDERRYSRGWGWEKVASGEQSSGHTASNNSVILSSFLHCLKVPEATIFDAVPLSVRSDLGVEKPVYIFFTSSHYWKQLQWVSVSCVPRKTNNSTQTKQAILQVVKMSEDNEEKCILVPDLYNLAFLCEIKAETASHSTIVPMTVNKLRSWGNIWICLPNSLVSILPLRLL